MKFITISLNQLLELDILDDSQSQKTPQNNNQKILALPAPSSSPGKRSGSSQKMNKDFRISSSKKKIQQK